jgi:hypothetical protein
MSGAFVMDLKSSFYLDEISWDIFFIRVEIISSIDYGNEIIM